eukprot:Gregarina_sp_Poly_1__10765@NODE_824_length_6127_cov_330_289274_g596_i0_p4_GENE_NODE_824_length_6127_cov_330_289274_g596_i0NODE_824_length_6127_cov_330_289274_g596_i0_p4_ORF_typecomplete_len154_score17_41Dapper/PF15268_6/0_0014_NODE_824_length_6127_cov_330_289274_g596_i024542915
MSHCPDKRPDERFRPVLTPPISLTVAEFLPLIRGPKKQTNLKLLPRTAPLLLSGASFVPPLVDVCEQLEYLVPVLRCATFLAKLVLAIANILHDPSPMHAVLVNSPLFLRDPPSLPNSSSPGSSFSPGNSAELKSSAWNYFGCWNLMETRIRT